MIVGSWPLTTGPAFEGPGISCCADDDATEPGFVLFPEFVDVFDLPELKLRLLCLRIGIAEDEACDDV